jgi:ankyrin repeat protein
MELLHAPGEKDNEGETPLERAGLQEVALMLIAKGADISARDNQGNTLLHKAARNDWMNLAQLLLAKGADVNAKNNEGKTPLREAGTGDVAELLKRHGATE